MKNSFNQYSQRIAIFSVIFFITSFWSLLGFSQISLVSTTGTTSGSYTTLNDAFTAINAGTHTGVITINVTGNTTEPNTPVPLLKSGTGSSSYTKVLIRPSGGNRIINSGPAPVTNRSIIELTGADNVTINGDDPATAGTQNLTIQAAAVTTVGVGCISLCSNSTSGADGADYDSILNCIIIGPRSVATSIVVNYCIRYMNGVAATTTGAYKNLGTVIMSNEIKRAYYGIYLVGASTTYPNAGIKILKNVIGSSVTNDNIGARGIYVTYSSTTSTSSTDNMQITGNDIRLGNYTTTGYNLTLSGIELSSYNVGARITQNILHDINQPVTSTTYGVYGISIISATQTSGIVIANNFFRDIKNANTLATPSSAGIAACVYFSAGPTSCIFNHNTMLMSTQLTTNTSKATVGVRLAANSTFAQFLNNLIVNTHSSSNAFVLYSAGNTNFSSGTLDNNVYFVNSGGKVGYFNGANTPTIQNWKDAVRQDVNTFLENPSFISATDLHLTAGVNSACESAGATTATTGILTDYDGTARPSTSSYGFGTKPDIGADEFDGKRNYTCTAPSPGVTVCSPATICLGESITLNTNISGFSGTGIYYQWQRSVNGTSYIDLFGEVFSFYKETPDKAYYYRLKVTCINGSVGYTTPVQVAFFNNIVGTTGGNRCGFGTVNLSGSGSAGSSLRWYDAASGGSLLGSGTSFTTPAIGSTTDYYVAAGQETTQTKNINLSQPTTDGYEPMSPFTGYYLSTKTQYIVTAAYMQNAGFAAGNINSLSLYINIKYSYDYFSNFTIKMANTSTSDLSGGFVTPTFTDVWGPTDYNTSAGDNTFTFTTPFYWDGTSNIVIQMCFDNTSYYYSDIDVIRVIPTPYMSSYTTYDDYNNLCSVMYGDYGDYGDNYMPDFNFNGQVICSGPRIPVTALVNPLPIASIIPATSPVSVCAGQMQLFSTAASGTYQWRNTAGHLTGETSSSFSTGTAGNYRVVVTNPVTGCKDSSTSITLVVNPLPIVNVTPVGTTRICTDSVLTLRSTHSGTALSFKWVKNGVVITAETRDSLKVSDTGKYRLVVISGSCSDTSNTSTVSLIPLPNSVISITDTISAICAGRPVEISANVIPAGYTYQWKFNGTNITGATTQKYLAGIPGDYTVLITDNDNCRKTSDSIPIILSPLGIPSISPNDANICDGVVMLLHGSGGDYAVNYIWEHDGTILSDTGKNLVVSKEGVYAVTVKDIYNCIAKSTSSIVNVMPGPVKPIITNTGSTLTTSLPYTTYQWYRNNKPVAAGNKRSIPLTFDGNYHVKVTNTEGCFAISDTLIIKNLSISSVHRNNDINVYPNPSQSIVNIDASVAINVEIKDIQGRSIASVNNATQIDISSYADGMYLLYIYDVEDNLLQMNKVIKRSN